MESEVRNKLPPGEGDICEANDVGVWRIICAPKASHLWGEVPPKGGGEGDGILRVSIKICPSQSASLTAPPGGGEPLNAGFYISAPIVGRDDLGAPPVGVTDCHVAALLAMTKISVCANVGDGVLDVPL